MARRQPWPHSCGSDISATDSTCARRCTYPCAASLRWLAAIVGCGALLEQRRQRRAARRRRCRAFGVTNGDGSLSTVAELGDVNGDGFDDYAVGLPSSDVGGADSGIVYVFLGTAARCRRRRRRSISRAASFTITGHGGEMLGYSIVGDDVNGDDLADIAIGAPMAGAPGKSGGGAVYVVFGALEPGERQHHDALADRRSRRTRLAPDATRRIGSRYDGFQQNSHTGMSLAALPDVNGDGYNDLAVGAPDADLHITGGGGVAVLYGKPQGVHITLNDLWENGYPYFFHVDFPALDEPARRHDRRERRAT